ncbi:MAG: hypothetical protein R8G33_05015 [Gammaproteobacteria bacterium]|nr:hypothetical protein [Gammaproteobacteria bacterium]
MNSRITELLKEIKEREDELEEVIKSYEGEFFYKIEGTKVKFDKLIEDAHRQLKTGLIQWFLNSELRNVITAPFIYSMIIPFLLIDIFISIYQLICFSLYKIPLVKRSEYIVVDRHHLKYLNAIERMHCMYCGYINGLISYMREIVARTEQYWCPIKHARKVLDPHRRYLKFSDFGNSERYQEHILAMRKSFDDD